MENRRFDAQKDLNQYGLDALATPMDYGTIARDIEQAGIDADRDQFDEEFFPYKKSNICNHYCRTCQLKPFRENT